MVVHEHNFHEDESSPFITGEISIHQRIYALQKENEQLRNALEESKSEQEKIGLYKSIFESSDMGICLLSLPYGEPVFFNHSLEELFDLKLNSQANQSFLKSVTTPEDWHIIESCMSAAKKGEISKSKWRVIHSKRSVEGIFYPVYRNETLSHIALYCKDSKSLNNLSNSIDLDAVENLHKENLHEKHFEDISQELLLPLQSFLSSASSLETIDGKENQTCFNNLKISADMLISVADTLFKITKDKKKSFVGRQKNTHERPKLKILLAEDDLMNQEVATILLTRLGAEVDLAEDGRQAVKMAEEKDYDIILMDMIMPHLNGLEATRLIHKKFQGKKMPHIIAMTANTFHEEKEECFKAGMEDFLPKPIVLKDLEKVIYQFTDSKVETTETKLKSRNDTNIHTDKYLHIDVDVIFSLSGINKHEGGHELAKQMINLYFDTVDQTFKNFQYAFEAEDEAELRRLAHSFTNAVKSIGADVMTQACNHIRKLCWENRISEIGKVLPLLEYENRLVLAELKRLLSEIE